MTQLDRIEDKQLDMDQRLRTIENALARMEGKEEGEGRAAFWIKHAAAVAVSFVAGFGGGNVKLPGLH